MPRHSISLSLSFIGFPTTADSISPSATPCFPPDTLRKGRNGLFQGRPAIRSLRNGAKDQAAWNFRLFNSRNSENIFHSLCTMLSVVDQSGWLCLLLIMKSISRDKAERCVLHLGLTMVCCAMLIRQVAPLVALLLCENLSSTACHCGDCARAHKSTLSFTKSHFAPRLLQPNTNSQTHAQ